MVIIAGYKKAAGVRAEIIQTLRTEFSGGGLSGG
jgi:hypothetical protein